MTPHTPYAPAIPMPPVSRPRIDDQELQALLATHAIDPANARWHNRPLWCVTGPTCEPSVFCCAIKDHGVNGGLCLGAHIWGYSVWGGEPGFRTLGERLTYWTAQQTARWNNVPRFYATLQAALAHVTELVTPACPAPWPVACPVVGKEAA